MDALQLRIDPNDKSPLGKKRKQFNNLLQKIDLLKDTIRRLEDQMQSGMVFFHAEILPLQQKQQRVQADYVRRLHQLYAHKAFTKKEREKMIDILLEAAIEVLEAAGTGEAEEFADIQEIFDLYNEDTWEEIQAEERQEASETANALFSSMGVDLNLDPEDDLDTIQEKTLAAAARFQQEAAERAEAAARAPKNKKQAAQEAAAQAKEMNVQKVSKNIYNDLVKLLHPDLEKDEALRAEKTEAMKEVNLAWQNNDFFGLLRLQSEYLSKHGDDIARLPDQQFNYYLAVLKKQKAELEEQLNVYEMVPGFPGYVYQHLTDPDEFRMSALRAQAVREEKQALKDLQHNLQLTQSPETLKPALKRYRITDPEDSFDPIELLRMMDALANMGKPGRKKRG